MMVDDMFPAIQHRIKSGKNIAVLNIILQWFKLKITEVLKW